MEAKNHRWEDDSSLLVCVQNEQAHEIETGQDEDKRQTDKNKTAPPTTFEERCIRNICLRRCNIVLCKRISIAYCLQRRIAQ